MANKYEKMIEDDLAALGPVATCMRAFEKRRFKGAMSSLYATFYEYEAEAQEMRRYAQEWYYDGKIDESTYRKALKMTQKYEAVHLAITEMT